ncbi:hypothetical protein BJ742DRAFT_779568 [Cladochytrium replicatum]|nr:hypothetical protein BJ742DRAFT_779568 [Cladochytrium replicatum]
MGGLRLISTSEDHREWMNAEQILGLIRNKKNFVDVTEGYLDALDTLKPLAKLAPPTDVKHQGLVVPILKMISEASMERFLTKLSSFNTRYYLSRSGRASTNWLYSQIKQLLAKHRNRHYKASVRLVKHNFPQPSIIVRIDPVSDDPSISFDSNPIVIVGSHHDSISYEGDPMTARSPGADDDGSGTTTIFEALRVILESKVLDQRSGWSKPIEYHWYAAEEVGLLGSQAVAADYRQRDVNVYAMWQCDMTGYTKPDEEAVIAVIGDYADPYFNDFVKKLAKTYSKLRAVDDNLAGYASSDHFSWTKAGYPAVFPFEAPFRISNPYVHTANDTVANINFSHMTEFVQTIIGWTIELSFD